MRVPREFDTESAGRAVAVGVVAVGVVIAVLAVALAGTAGAGSTGNASSVGSCTTIDTPGRYVLTKDITTNAAGKSGSCIEITASNVVLDGAGHTLSGSGSGHGVDVNGSATPVSNVRVKRLHAHDWQVGVFLLSANDGTVRNTITNDTTEGIALGTSSGNRLVGNTAYENAIGVAFGGSSHNNTVRNEVAVDNKWGIHFERESGGNTVRNSVARNNSHWDYYATEDKATNTVSGLETATANVSFTEQNVALRAVTSPPALPSNTGNLDSYLEAAKTSGNSFSLSLTMQYGSSTRKSVGLWRTSGGGWSRVSGAKTDQSSNAVSANVTQFGTFGVLANGGGGGPVTVATSQPPSVRRTLTTRGASTTPETASSGNSSSGGPAPTQQAAGTPSNASGTNGNGSGASGDSGNASAGGTSENNGSSKSTNGSSGSGNGGSGAFGPGFGFGVALVALVAAALVALRRTR